MWDVDATSELLRLMSCATEPSDLLRFILAHARRSVHLERAIVLSREGLEYPLYRVLRVASGERDADSLPENPDIVRAGGVLADLLYAGRFCSRTALAIDATEPAHDLLRGSRSLVAFPLFEHGDSAGMVVLLGPSPHECGSTELCGLAIMGALLQRTDRAHALAGQLQATCRALDAELTAAENVQRWLLPPLMPSAAGGVCVAASYRTARHAGGDYYDAGALPDGRFGVLIADVSGHGAGAAVLMAILRTIVHDEVDQSLVAAPAALLDYADDRLCKLDIASRGAFVTAFSGALSTTTGEFTYSCAGHPRPRLLRARDRTIESLDRACSQPLGVLKDRPPRSQESVILTPGDLLVFYSDGITEARSPGDELFGVERLDQVLRELPDPTTSDAAIRAIGNAVELFSGSAPPCDDETSLDVCWSGD